MKSSQNPILIIDRCGLIGEPLSLKLSKEFLTVFVSQSPSANITFHQKFPVIPDNKFSHIIFIDEEGRDLELLSGIIDRVKNVNANFIFARGLFSKKEYTDNKILRMCPSAKIVLFGDAFTDKLILRKENSKSVINRFIHQAQKFGRIQVLGNGLKETYPVFLEDVVNGLIDLVFGMHRSHSLFYAFPKHPPTELSLAHMLQKANPEITVDFIKQSLKPEKISYPPNGINLLEDKYPLAQKIRKIDIKRRVEVQEDSLGKNRTKPKAFSLFIISILIFLFFSPLIFTITFSFVGKNIFYYGKGEINKDNFAGAKSALHLSQVFFYAGLKTANALSFQARTLGLENNLKGLLKNLELGYKVSDGLSQAVNSEIYFSKLLSGKSENPADDFAKGQSYLKNSIIALNRIKAEEKNSAPILQNLESINSLIKLLSDTLDVMPAVLGMESPKTYLILFQNNAQLRPGGGIIDSYGILKIDKGKIAEFSTHAVGDADEQLRGHIEPPFALRRYLGLKHWYLKDSNFNLDFVKTAALASKILLAETGQKASGVIALNSSFADKDNLDSLMQAQPFLIIQAISNALTQKHLMLAFEDGQNIFTVNGWTASLWDERKDSGKSVNDFVGINEASLGQNKINNFIKRQIFQEVTILDNGEILEELTVNYKNDSITKEGNDYKNYLSFILPEKIELQGISINDAPQNVADAITDPLIYEAKNFKAPLGLEVEKTTEENKTVYGFLVPVPAGEIVKIKLKYKVFKNIFGLDNFSYNLKFFKQPGIDSISYSFSMTIPKIFNVLNISKGMNKKEGKISYSQRIEKDENLVINFAKK